MSVELSCENLNSESGQGTIVLLQDEPAFSDLLSHDVQLQGDPVDALFNSTEKRLARMLLVLANFGKKDQEQPVIPKVSQDTLAEIIGTTGSRVNFYLNKFRALGLIA